MVLKNIFFNWPIKARTAYGSHISCMFSTKLKYGNFVHDLLYIIPTKLQFIVAPSFRGEDF